MLEIKTNSRFGDIDVLEKEPIKKKLKKIFFFMVTREGIENDKQRVSFLRYFLSGTIAFKLAGRYLSWRYKHSKKNHKTDLNLDDSNLKEIYDYTVSQNISQPSEGSNRRSEIYYKLLSLPPLEPKKSSLLIIGGKNVTEIFIAWLYGFKWKNIEAIDLYSLHPKIKIMSMENMTFADNSFECISMSNVYGYNDDPIQAFREISRVLKKGGLFSFNSVYAKDAKTKSYRTSSDELKKIFRDLSFEVLYHLQTPKENNGTGDIWLLKKYV